MLIGSLFSGIGGLDRAVGHPSLLCERDPYARRVLARHWPGVECVEDVRDIGDVGADVVIGGPPCQAASHAGKRAGKADDRWLWPEAIRVVGANRPRWAFFENVAGLPTLDNGEPFAEILRDLDRLGYAVRWDHAEAASAGAPHRRDRVWLLCVRHDDWTAPTLAASVQQGLFGSAPPVEWSRAGWYARGRWGVEAARWGKVGERLWPTPNVLDANNRASLTAVRDGSKGGMGTGTLGETLVDAVRISIGMWPTPATADGERSSDTYCRGNPTLVGAARASLWPTPTASDGVKDPTRSLGRMVQTGEVYSPGDHRRVDPRTTREAGMLNPDFAEWLMGWPRGWTLPHGPSLADAPVPGWGGDLALYNGRPAPRDVPLLTTEREHRRPRLRCVGNGVVTACASMVLAELASGLLDVRGAA